VGSSDDCVGVQESTTTRVPSRALQRDNVGELSLAGRLAANNVLEGLGNRDGGDTSDGGQRRGGESELGNHCDGGMCGMSRED
jgi:hypothetical protein